MTGPVTITIDVLAVSGLDRAQARAFGRALERALTALVGASGLPHAAASAGVRPSMALAGIAVRADQPEQAGEAVARAIYRGLAS